MSQTIETSASRVTILLIEDNPGDARLLELMLASGPDRFNLRLADRLTTGLEFLEREAADVVLLDLNLPDCNGPESIVRLKEADFNLPVVVLTGLSDEDLALQALREGAQDYLVKGQFGPDLLVRAIYYAQERHQVQEALRASEARLCKIIENDIDAIMIINKGGLIDFANPAAVTLFNIEMEELVGSTFGFPLSHSSAEIDIFPREKDPVIAEMRVVELEWEDGRGYLASIRDITERKENETRLQELASELEQTVVELTNYKKIIEEQNRRLNQLSIRDELTALYNRRHMLEVLEKEFVRARRYSNELSCLLMDLDFFKTINDTYGHVFGDLVLKEFAAFIDKNSRLSDTCFRYGGEEFLILLPQTGLQGASQVAEKIRKFCESNIYREGPHAATVTVSIGLASLKDHNPSQPKDLISYADKALYTAKVEGRNQVKVYSPGAMDLPVEGHCGSMGGGPEYPSVSYNGKDQTSLS